MIKIGVIGCGYWGPQRPRNFNEIPDTDLTWISDLRSDRLQHMQTLYPRVCTTTDYRQVLESDVNGVVIATSVGSHYKLGCEALEAGKHVLMEKPLAATVSEAADLVKRADKSRKTLLVGHTFLYNPAVTTFAKLFNRVSCGGHLLHQCHTCQLGALPARCQCSVGLSPPRCVDSQLHFGGTANKGMCIRRYVHTAAVRGIHDVAYLSLSYPNQVMAQVRISWLDPVKVRRYTIVGSRKMLVYDDIAHAKLVIYDKGVDAPPYSDTYNNFSFPIATVLSKLFQIFWSEPLRNECIDFARAIRDGVAPVSNGHVGLQVVKILECADRSLLSNGQAEEIEL